MAREGRGKEKDNQLSRRISHFREWNTCFKQHSHDHYSRKNNKSLRDALSRTSGAFGLPTKEDQTLEPSIAGALLSTRDYLTLEAVGKTGVIKITLQK